MLKSLRGLTPAQALVIVVVALLPVVHSMLLMRSYRTPQLALLIVALGGMVAFAFNGSFEWLRRETKTVKLSVAFFGAAVLWMTIAALVGVDPDRSLMGHAFQSTGLLLWFVMFGLYVLTLRHRSVLAGRVEGATLFAWTVLFVFLAMWLAGRELVQEFLVPVNDGGVPLPGIGQSAFLASFAGVGLLLAAGRWLRAPKKFGWLAMAALVSAFLAVTQARFPIIFAVLSVGAGLLIVRRRGTNAMVVGALAVVVVTAGIASHLLVIPWIQGLQAGPAPKADPLDRVAPLEESVAAERDLRGRFAPTAVASGVQFRLTVWGVAARAGLREPWFGNGPANFTYSYRRLATAADIKQIGDPDREMQDAHNIFMEVAATSGLPAALFLLAGMVALGWSVFAGRPAPRHDGLTWLRLGALGFLGVLLVEPLSLVVMPLIAIFAGAGAGGPIVPGTTSEPLEPPSSSATLSEIVPRGAATPLSPPARPWSAARRIPAVLVFIAALLVAGSFIWSDRLLARGALLWDRHALAAAVKFDPTCQQCLYQLSKVRSWDFKKKGEGSEAWALAPFKRAIERQPEDSEAYLRFGGGLIFLDRPLLAIAPLKEARRLNPYSASAAVALAGAYLEAGRPADALKAAQDAVRIHPSAMAYDVIAEAAGQLGLATLKEHTLAEAKKLEPNRNRR